MYSSTGSTIKLTYNIYSQEIVASSNKKQVNACPASPISHRSLLAFSPAFLQDQPGHKGRELLGKTLQHPHFPRPLRHPHLLHQMGQGPQWVCLALIWADVEGSVGLLVAYPTPLLALWAVEKKGDYQQFIHDIAHVRWVYVHLQLLYSAHVRMYV